MFRIKHFLSGLICIAFAINTFSFAKASDKSGFHNSENSFHVNSKNKSHTYYFLPAVEIEDDSIDGTDTTTEGGDTFDFVSNYFDSDSVIFLCQVHQGEQLYDSFFEKQYKLIASWIKHSQIIR